MARAVALGVAPVRTDIDRLAWAVGDLREEIRTMAGMHEEVAADIAALKGQVAGMAAAYEKAAADTLATKLADAKAAWEQDDEAAWASAHAQLSALSQQLTAGQPITPPASEGDPKPAPVQAGSSVAATTAGDAGTGTGTVAGDGGAAAPMKDGTSGTGTTNAVNEGGSVGLAGADAPTQ